MSRPGWLKLYNQTLDSDFWIASDEPFDCRSAFIHVLLSSNWRKGTSKKCGRTITIERGQCLTSIRKLMSTFHWSRKRVENWLKWMSDYGMITHQSVGFGTVLTVENYDKYQCDGASEWHSEEHSEWHSEEHSERHSKERNEEHSEEPRSKTKDRRQQKEDIKSAHAGPPPVTWIGPPIGSPEWYAQHNDD